MNEPTPNYRRSFVWSVKLKYHPPASAPREGAPIISLTVTADNYEDAIDGAIWAAITNPSGPRINAVEDDYEVIEVVRHNGCTVV